MNVNRKEVVLTFKWNPEQAHGDAWLASYHLWTQSNLIRYAGKTFLNTKKPSPKRLTPKKKTPKLISVSSASEPLETTTRVTKIRGNYDEWVSEWVSVLGSAHLHHRRAAQVLSKPKTNDWFLRISAFPTVAASPLGLNPGEKLSKVVGKALTFLHFHLYVFPGWKQVPMRINEYRYLLNSTVGGAQFGRQLRNCRTEPPTALFGGCL